MEKSQSCPWVATHWNGRVVYRRQHPLEMEIVRTKFAIMDLWQTSVLHPYVFTVTDSFSTLIAGAGKSVFW